MVGGGGRAVPAGGRGPKIGCGTDGPSISFRFRSTCSRSTHAVGNHSRKHVGPG